MLVDQAIKFDKLRGFKQINKIAHSNSTVTSPLRLVPKVIPILKSRILLKQCNIKPSFQDAKNES